MQNRYYGEGDECDFPLGGAVAFESNGQTGARTVSEYADDGATVLYLPDGTPLGLAPKKVGFVR